MTQKKDPGLEIKDEGSSCTISVKVLPRSSRNMVVGVENGVLKIKVQAPPVEGAANEALIDFLSKILARPRNSIEVLKGQTSRHKLIRLKGMERTEVLKTILEL